MIDDGSFERRVSASTRCLADVRRGLRHWLEGAVAGCSRRTDIVIAASELATAAMRGVLPDAVGHVVISAWVDDGDVVIETRAEADDGDVVGASTLVFDGTDGERGFSIVAALSDVFAVKGTPHGVLVRARLSGVGVDAMPTT